MTCLGEEPSNLHTVTGALWCADMARTSGPGDHVLCRRHDVSASIAATRVDPAATTAGEQRDDDDDREHHDRDGDQDDP